MKLFLKDMCIENVMCPMSTLTRCGKENATNNAVIEEEHLKLNRSKPGTLLEL